jgi:hypothetical protein
MARSAIKLKPTVLADLLCVFHLNAVESGSRFNRYNCATEAGGNTHRDAPEAASSFKVLSSSCVQAVISLEARDNTWRHV